MSNHDNPALPANPRTGVINAIVGSLLPITALFVAFRFYVRRVIRNSLGADDWLALLSLVIATVDGIFMCLMSTTGLGNHIWTLTTEEIKKYRMLFYYSIVFYYIGLGAVKLAILSQYLRILTGRVRRITILVTVAVAAWSISLIFISIFVCRPIRGFWDRSIAANCIPSLPEWYINATGNIISDVVIFGLPLPAFWKIHLPPPQRLSLIAVFCLGFFTCAISVIRVSFLNLTTDDTYHNVDAAGWSIGELCSGIILSCLPTLRPLLFRFVPRRSGAPASVSCEQTYQLCNQKRPYREPNAVVAQWPKENVLDRRGVRKQSDPNLLEDEEMQVGLAGIPLSKIKPREPPRARRCPERSPRPTHKELEVPIPRPQAKIWARYYGQEGHRASSLPPNIAERLGPQQGTSTTISSGSLARPLPPLPTDSGIRIKWEIAQSVQTTNSEASVHPENG